MEDLLPLRSPKWNFGPETRKTKSIRSSVHVFEHTPPQWDPEDLIPLCSPLSDHGPTEPSSKSVTSAERPAYSTHSDGHSERPYSGFWVPPLPWEHQSFSTKLTIENYDIPTKTEPSLHLITTEATEDCILALNEPLVPWKTRCPRCRVPLGDHVTNLRPFERIEQCQRCCEEEREQRLEEWTIRCYPNIQWDTFPDRIASKIPLIEEWLNSGEVPIFREWHQHKREGSLPDEVCDLVELCTETPAGYYGSRGFLQVFYFLTDNMKPQVKAAALHDNLLRRNVPEYLMSVIVRGIFHVLIMEDMDADVMMALKLTEEGGELGIYFNEDEESADM